MGALAYDAIELDFWPEACCGVARWLDQCGMNDNFRTASDIGWTKFKTQAYISNAGGGAISGVVEVNGVPAAGIWVYLLYRGSEDQSIIQGDITFVGDTWLWPIMRCKSDANGAFSFSNCLLPSNKYAVLAIDPDGGVQYNIARHDRVTPV